MKAEPKKRLARTPVSILVALALTPNRENKAKFRFWRSFTDFPKKQRNGYDIEELKAFLDRHFDEFLADSKRAKAIESGDSFTGADKKMLQAASSGKAVGRSAGGMDSLNDETGIEGGAEVAGLEGAANLLRQHFKVPVTKQDIQDWSRGKRLDHGVPNFPVAKDSNRRNKLECINWFKAHKFTDPRQSSTPDLFKKLETEQVRGDLERLEHERLLRGVERGLYMERAEHNRILAGLGRIGRDNLWELFDRRSYDDFARILKEAGVPNEWQPVALDQLRVLMPRLLLQHHAHLEAVIQEAESPVNAGSDGEGVLKAAPCGQQQERTL